MSKLFLSLFIFSIIGFTAQKSFAHCEIPCGIYNDELRIALLYEHFTTIEKAMKNINDLSQEPGKNSMMITRWTMAKEDHANKVQEIAEQYFLTQRVKPVSENDAENFKRYQQQLMALHQIIVSAMKTKQTTEPEHVEMLRKTLSMFEEIYFKGQHRHKIEQDKH